MKAAYKANMMSVGGSGFNRSNMYHCFRGI